MHQTLECGLLDGRVSGNDGNHSVGQDPALLFTDDLMLDFGTTGQMDTLLVEEMGFQEMQDLPW